MSAPPIRTLRELRIAAGLTLPELAERAGLDKGLLSYLERGRMHPNTYELERLEAALELELTTRLQIIARADLER